MSYRIEEELLPLGLDQKYHFTGEELSTSLARTGKWGARRLVARSAPSIFAGLKASFNRAALAGEREGK